MRHTRLPVCLCLAACLGGPGDTALDPPPASPSPRVTVDGVVLDSLGGNLVGGAGVVLHDVGAITGPDGRFTLDVPTGVLTLAVSSPGHEGLQQPVVVNGPMHLPVRLRRLAPLLVGCSLEPDTIRAVVVDLQGRKTVDRREGSTIMLFIGSDSLQLIGLDWYWRPVDYFTWHVRVPVAGLTVTRARWVVRDTDGYATTVTC